MEQGTVPSDEDLVDGLRNIAVVAAKPASTVLATHGHTTTATGLTKHTKEESQ